MQKAEMYAPERKEDFLRDYCTGEKRKEALRVLFRAVGTEEHKLDKDLCQMTDEEANNVVEAVIGLRRRSADARRAPLKDYTRWCLETGVPGATLLLSEENIRNGSLQKMRHQMVASPAHLQRFLDSIFPSEVEMTVDIIYRAFYWLAFCGVRDEELALNLTKENLDIWHKEITIGHRMYRIVPEAAKSLRMCATLRDFRYDHPEYQTALRPRADGDKLLRGYRGEPSIRSFRAIISKKVKERAFLTPSSEDDIRDSSLSYDRVWLSGRFYFMRKGELAGDPVDFFDLAEEYTSGKMYRLSAGGNKQEAKTRWVAADYLRDYNRWKQVFYPDESKC